MDFIFNLLGILALFLFGVVLVLLVLAGVALFLGGQDFLKSVGRIFVETVFWERRFPSLTELSNLRRASAEPIPAVTAEPTAAVPPPPSQQALLAAPASPSVAPQLRNPVADFVGRADHIETITACLRQQRGAAISAIGGQGGVGKTELAFYVAGRVHDLYRDGHVLVDLRGLDAKPATPAEAMRDVLVALIPDQKLPDNDQHFAGLYQGLLAERRVLILADNAKDSEQVAPLVPNPPSALLVTSRQSIPLPGVEPVNLDELAPDEAAKLLRKNVGEDRASDDEIARLAELCGYLPLALRAAGERLAGLRALSTAAYLGKLERDRGDLRYQGREVMAVLAGSVEALAQEQPELVEKWRSLGVFAAPFDRPAAEAVGELDDEELEVLVSRNLVLFDGKEERFRLHDLFRDLAREGLADESEYVAAKRHAGHFLAVAAAADDRYDEGNEGVLDGLGSFDRERTHIEAGQAWAAAHAEDDDEAAAFAQGYPLRAPSVLVLRRHARDRINWLETSAQAARKLGNRKQEGLALGNLGNAYSELGETRKAIEYYEQDLAIARETGDRRGEGMALGNLGNAYSDLGKPRKAIEHYQQRLDIARETGDRRGEGQALGNLGIAYSDLGEPRKAIEYYEQQLGITRETGDRRGEGAALGNLGNAYRDLGEPRKAIEYYKQHLDIARETGDRRGEGRALGNLGIAYSELGETRKAIEYYEQHLDIARETGDRRGEGQALGNLGNAYSALGETRKAIECYEQHLGITRETGDRRGEGMALHNRATALDDLGRREEAIADARAALTICEEIEDSTIDQTRQMLAGWGVLPDE